MIKGGFLIASLLGVDTRLTHDIDTTMVGISVEPEKLMKVFTENIEPIRDDDEYSGYRIHFSGLIYNKIKPQFKIDVSTGDRITPREVQYKHHLITENRTIVIMAYNVETIIAEKLETVISRGITNTRAKDFYDLYALSKVEKQNINFEQLRNALINTSEHRGTIKLMSEYNQIFANVEQNNIMIQSWKRYQEAHEFAKYINFRETCEAGIELMNRMEWDG